MAYYEIDCRKCLNCTGYSCLIYGEDESSAVKKCAEKCFKNYIDVSKCKKCEFNSNNSYCTRYNDGLKHSIKKCKKHKCSIDNTVSMPKDINVEKTEETKEKPIDYNTLTIEMTDGSTSTYKDGQWDDWDLIGDFLVVLDKDNKWIGMRNKSMIKKVDMYHG